MNPQPPTKTPWLTVTVLVLLASLVGLWASRAGAQQDPYRDAPVIQGKAMESAGVNQNPNPSPNQPGILEGQLVWLEQKTLGRLGKIRTDDGAIVAAWFGPELQDYLEPGRQVKLGGTPAGTLFTVSKIMVEEPTPEILGTYPVVGRSGNVVRARVGSTLVSVWANPRHPDTVVLAVYKGQYVNL